MASLDLEEQADLGGIRPPILEDGEVRQESLLRFLHAQAVAGAGTARLDRMAALLERFAERMREAGLLEEPIRLPRFEAEDSGRQRFVQREWAMNDWFYGIGPKPEEG